jgi:hypothetical protein
VRQVADGSVWKDGPIVFLNHICYTFQQEGRIMEGSRGMRATGDGRIVLGEGPGGGGHGWGWYPCFGNAMQEVCR